MITTTIVCFTAARDGGVMTHWMGKIAFPERGGPQPQAGESWEVEYAGTNPRGNVVFLRCISKFEVGDKRISTIVTLRSEHNGDDKTFTYCDRQYRNARDDREHASIEVEWWPAIRDTMSREIWHKDDDQTPRMGRRTSHGSSNFCYTAAYELVPAGVIAFEYAIAYKSADAAKKSTIHNWLKEMGIMAPAGFIWTPLTYEQKEEIRAKVGGE